MPVANIVVTQMLCRSYVAWRRLIQNTNQLQDNKQILGRRRKILNARHTQNCPSQHPLVEQFCWVMMASAWTVRHLFMNELFDSIHSIFQFVCTSWEMYHIPSMEMTAHQFANIYRPHQNESACLLANERANKCINNNPQWAVISQNEITTTIPTRTTKNILQTIWIWLFHYLCYLHDPKHTHTQRHTDTQTRSCVMSLGIKCVHFWRHYIPCASRPKQQMSFCVCARHCSIVLYIFVYYWL